MNMFLCSGWFPEGSPLLAAAVVLMAVAAVWWLYLPQVKETGRLWRWVLPGLRLMAMAALAVALLQPVLRWSSSSPPAGAVVVVVDHSLSMGVVDRRSEAELIALADGLGLLPPGRREQVMPGLHGRLEHLDALARQVTERRAALRYARLSGREVDLAEAHLVDAVREFESATAVLAALGATARQEHGLAEHLAALGEIAPFDDRSDWLSEVQATIRPAQVALRLNQADLDEQLYQDDPRVREICDELSDLSRLGVVERALVGGSGLLHRLDPAVAVYGYALADDLRPLPLHREGRPVARLLLEPRGMMTDLAGAVQQAMNRLGERRLEAVWVFSDGRQAGGDAHVTAPLVWSGVPVHVVNVAGEVRQDVWVQSADVPARLFAGERTTVVVEIAAIGLAGREAMVTFQHRPDAAMTAEGSGEDVGQDGGSVSGSPGRQPAADSRQQDSLLPAAGGPLPAPLPNSPPHHAAITRQVILPDDGQTARVEFEVSIADPGAHRVVIEVERFPDETSFENNRVERAVRVLEQRVRVALFSDGPNRDGQLLRHLLAGSAWAELTDGWPQASVPGSVSGGLVSGELLPSDSPLTTHQVSRQQDSLLPAAGGPPPAPLTTHLDVVVLHDFHPDQLSSPEWSEVHRLVRDGGGGVVLIAGERHGRRSIEQVLLLDLLPYPADGQPQWRVWPGEQPVFRLEAADEVRAEGVFGGEMSGRWGRLPPLFGYLPLTQLKPGVVPLLVERETGHAVVTETRLSYPGRVVFVGLNETWRWRFRHSEDYSRFWSGLIRYAAEQPYAVRRGEIALDADRLWMEPEESVHVRVRVPEGDSAARPPRVQVMRGTGPPWPGERVVRTVPLGRAGPDQSGRFEVTLRGLEPGAYRLRLDHESVQRQEQAVELPLRVRTSYEEEIRNVAADEALLNRLAQVTGGRALPLERSRELGVLLTEQQAQRREVVEYPLWHSPLLFLFVLGCLGAEWALRKKAGLV